MSLLQCLQSASNVVHRQLLLLGKLLPPYQKSLTSITFPSDSLKAVRGAVPADVRTPARASATTFSTSASAASSTPSPYLESRARIWRKDWRQASPWCPPWPLQWVQPKHVKPVIVLLEDNTFSISLAMSFMVLWSSGIFISLAWHPIKYSKDSCKEFLLIHGMHDISTFSQTALHFNHGYNDTYR